VDVTMLSDNQEFRELSAILREECAELIMALCKIERFGLFSEWQGVSNIDNLEQELADVKLIIRLVEAYLMKNSPQLNGNFTRESQDEKYSNKLSKLLKWSKVDTTSLLQ